VRIGGGNNGEGGKYWKKKLALWILYAGKDKLIMTGTILRRNSSETFTGDSTNVGTCLALSARQ